MKEPKEQDFKKLFQKTHSPGHKLNIEDCTHLLLSTKKVLDENNIEFFLAFGTLLGYYRDNSFIPTDTDIDIGVHASDGEKLKKLILEGYFDSYGLIYCRNYEDNLYSLMYKNEYIDIGIFSKTDNYYSINGVYNVHKDIFESGFKKVTFIGHQFNIFNKTEDFLTAMYGDWKVPSKKHAER